MRPRSLSIRGLHSFREKQVIDFDALTEAGIFGIFGPTGSGKSTILDALTLALYGRVERAGASIQGIIHQMEKQMEVNFTFSVGRAREEMTYEVERLYQVQASGGVSLQSCRVFALETDVDGCVGKLPLAEGRAAVDAQVRQILGLSMHDFTRAVVLPQGKFAEFLQLKGKERNEMIERLFGLERFGRNLFELIKSHLVRESNTLSQHLAALAELADATEDAVAGAQKERLAALATLEQCDAAYRKVSGDYENARAQWQLQTNYERACLHVKAHEERQTEIDELRAVVERSQRAELVWPFVEARIIACQKRDEEAARFADANRKDQAARQLRDAENCALEEARRKRQADEPEGLMLLGALDVGRNKEKEREREAQRLFVLHKQRAHASREAEEVRAEALAQEEALQGTREREKACEWLAQSCYVTRERRAAVERSARAYERWSAAVAAFAQACKEHERGQAYAKQVETEYAETWRAQQALLAEDMALEERLIALQENFTQEAEERERGVWIAALRVNGEQLRDAEERYGEAAARVRAVKERHARAVIAEELARRAFDAAREVHEALQDARKERTHTDRRALFAQAANELRTGEPCPVCGSLYHPHLAQEDVIDCDDDEQMLLSDLHRHELDARAAFEQTRDAHDQARLVLNTTEAEYQLVMSYEADCTQVWEASWRRLVSCFEAGGPSESLQAKVSQIFADGVPKRASEFFRGYETLVKTTERMREEREQRESEWLDLRAVRETRQEALSQYATRLATLQERRATIFERLTEWAARQAEAKRECDDATEQWQAAALSSGVDGTLGEKEAALAVLRLRETLLDDEKRSEHARQEAAELRAESEARQVSLDALRKKLAACETQLESVASECVSAEQLVERLGRELAELTGGISIAEKIDEVNALLTGLREQEEAAHRRFEEAGTFAKEAQRIREMVSVKLNLAEDEVCRASEGLAQALCEVGFRDETEVRQAKRTAHEREALETDIRVFEDERLRLRSIAAELASKMGQTRVSEQVWQEICTAREETERRFEAAKRLWIEKEKQERDTLLRHERYVELNALRKEAELRVQQLESLKTLLTGNRFVEYMAREQMKQVAAVATQRLSVLTRGRYGLELEGDGSFVMRDDHHGGLRRSVSTLSGGETFLTSLALALALSAQIQLRGHHPLSFFFLDEGFGTLDQERLDIVISALERLHMDELSIGLISHVPELRDRMARRLIVVPAEPAGRGTRVTLERA